MKRNNYLDFTSLLDVIMILLFIVLTSIGNKAITAQEQLTESLAEADSRINELEKKNEDLQNDLTDIEATYQELNSQFETLSQQYNDLLLIHEKSLDNSDIYSAVINKITKILLVCNPEQDKRTGDWNVAIELYLGKNYNKETQYINTTSIIHDLNLSNSDRKVFNEKQTNQIVEFLDSNLDNHDVDAFYIILQYPYSDENISSLDLSVLEESIKRYELKTNVKCIVEEYAMR